MGSGERVINLNSKTFIALSNTANGEVSDETEFHYHEADGLVWAEYSGGDILRGTLLGKRLNEIEIEFNYQHVSSDMSLKAGYCRSMISMDGGRIKLSEKWRWYSGDCSEGRSELVENIGVS